MAISQYEINSFSEFNERISEAYKEGFTFYRGDKVKGNIKVGYGLLNIGVTSLKKFEIELLAYVSNPMLVDISKLSSVDEVYNLFMKDPAANNTETLDKLVRA